MVQINLIKYTFKYLIVNKPAGIQTDGFTYNSLLPQLSKLFKALHPNKLTPDKFQLVQRLDKFVTGGLLVSRDEKFTKRINKSLAGNSTSLSVTRRYVGLIPLTKSMAETHDGYGVICGDIDAIKDRTKEIVSYNAETKYKLLSHLKLSPTKTQIRNYGKLYNPNHSIYPIILELTTGRKNQIRDHILQAFKVPLLNDDKFSRFKFISHKNDNGGNINSEIFKSNQIGLHSAYMKLTSSGKVIEELTFPVHVVEDRELWSGFVDEETGELLEHLKQELRQFNPPVDEEKTGVDIGKNLTTPATTSDA